MASKRQRKKEHKKQLQQRFKTQDLSYKELLIKEEQAEKRRKQREVRYQKNKQLISESGFDISISKNTSTEQVKELIKKEKRKQSRLKTQQKKIDLLVNAGLSKAEAEEFKNAKYEDIYNIINITYKSDKWVAVAWWDRTGESDLRSSLQEIQSMTTQEKINEIHKMYEEAQGKPNNSNGCQGVAMFVHGNSKEDTKRRLESYRKRDYPLSVPFNYVNIGISNEFSVEGVVDMMYISMAQTPNVERVRFYDDVKYFMKINVPEIYKRIF